MKSLSAAFTMMIVLSSLSSTSAKADTIQAPAVVSPAAQATPDANLLAGTPSKVAAAPLALTPVTPSIGGCVSTGVKSCTPASVTPVVPEPSSIVLLGTGALSLAGMVRRRFASRKA